MCYSVQPRNKVFLKGYGVLYFAKKTWTKILLGIKVKTFAVKSNQKLDHAKQSAIDTIKTASEKSNSKNRRSN